MCNNGGRSEKLIILIFATCKVVWAVQLDFSFWSLGPLNGTRAGACRTHPDDTCFVTQCHSRFKVDLNLHNIIHVTII